MTTHSIHTEGADLVYEVEGTGPTLLLISGGGGDAARYAGVSEILSDRYQVVRYDRRCNHRSTGDYTRDLDMRQQARDAAAIIRAVDDQAIVFGNSGGGSIAMELLISFPELVRVMVVHEPPAIALHPDNLKHFEYAKRINAIYQERGALQAMREFTSNIPGTTQVDPESWEPGTYGNHPEDGWEFFMAHEYLNITRYAPDVGTIAASEIPVAFVAGAITQAAGFGTLTPLLAKLTDKIFFQFPGHHTSHNEPEEHAPAIHDAVQRLLASR